MTTERQIDVFEYRFGKFDPRVNRGRDPHPRLGDQMREETAILDEAARRRRVFVQEHFDKHAHEFPADPHPKSYLQIEEELAFEEARRRREMLAARGTQIVRPGQSYPDEALPREPELPPENWRPLASWVKREILICALHLNAQAPEAVAGVHLFSPTTGRHLGLPFAQPNPPPGMKPNFDTVIHIGVPFKETKEELARNLDKVEFSLGRPIRYNS